MHCGRYYTARLDRAEMIIWAAGWPTSTIRGRYDPNANSDSTSTDKPLQDAMPSHVWTAPSL